jgi:hypothetical protein
MDGMVMAYDLQTFQLMSQLPETKGVIAFAIHEKSSMLAVLNKKKLSLYLWQGTSFLLRREITLSTEAKCLLCASNLVVVGYKRYYETIDILTLAVTRILDFEKDHKMVCLELPLTSLRPSSVLLSIGLQGVVLDTLTSKSNSINSSGSAYEERMEWSSPPSSAHLMAPFIMSLLADSVEIHDMASLYSLQRITLSSGPCNMCLYPFLMVGRGVENAFISTGDQISVLKMVHLSSQVLTLVETGLYEEAINLCSLCPNSSQLRDIDIPRIHEKFAFSLFQKGDFEGAISHYILANTELLSVIAKFPDLVPVSLHSWVGLTNSNSNKGKTSSLDGMILHRAAAALVHFCEQYRSNVRQQEERAQKVKSAGIGAAVQHPTDDADPDFTIRKAEILDTVLLSSLAQCSPPRRTAVVDLLSTSNSCHIESCSVILASQGNAFTEALLWLYRSHNEHKRVLSALTEDRCVGAGAWTREQFYQWTADYLRWLWHNDNNLLPPMVLSNLKPLIEYDAELGLGVLITRPKNLNNSSSLGGRGVSSVQTIVTFLKSITPKAYSVSTQFGSKTTTSGRFTKQTRQPIDLTGLPIPLVNGKALAAAYLEWLVDSGAALPIMHNEFAQLIIDTVPKDLNIDHNINDLEIISGESESLLLYKIYRKKLQFFLQSSRDYSPEILLEFIPSDFEHENALLLSRLGRHEEVFQIYIHKLNDIPLAESYCDRIYNNDNENNKQKWTSSNSLENFKNNCNSIEDAKDVYLLLIKVILNTPIDEENKKISPLTIAINLAERNFKRINSTEFLDLLPKNSPLSALQRYLSITIEYNNSRKRNLQVIHQLLRLREVNLRTKSFTPK